MTGRTRSIQPAQGGGDARHGSRQRIDQQEDAAADAGSGQELPDHSSRPFMSPSFVRPSFIRPAPKPAARTSRRRNLASVGSFRLPPPPTGGAPTEHSIPMYRQP